MMVDSPLQCLLCKEDFQSQGDVSPYGLSCGHTFCRRDIRAIVREQEKVLCPVCPVETDLNFYVGGFTARNVNLIECIDRFCEMWGSGRKDAVLMCSNCDADANQQEATVFCTACLVDLCNDCGKKVHAPKAIRKHQRIPSGSKSCQVFKCTIHGEAIKRYCKDCKR